ncbi:hypothetical protein JXA12_00690 [Candidatus Woesearchaeota archaeon]|nr:hypothetical protein [Candidatus Woesearchaeota archaeon]
MAPSLAMSLSYQEGIHLIRPDSKYITDTFTVPEYLTVEDVTFISCLEEELPLRNSLLCLDDNSFEDLESIPWPGSDNCYVSSYNLEDFECEQLVLQAEYTKEGENYKMTRTIRVNKLSKVLDRIVDTQYSDGGWRDPLSTAYGIWSLSYFRDIYEYEINLAMAWLKNDRNEEQKCWPSAPCNVELSGNILALLTLSNYTGELLEDPDARRVVNDVTNWFEKLQNVYRQGDEWTLAVEAVNNDTTLVLAAYDAVVLDENFTLPDTGHKNYTFAAKMDSEIIVISDDNVIVDIYNGDGEDLLDYQGDNLSYTIPGACWSLNRKGEPCDATTSMYALFAEIDEENREIAYEWARTRLESGAILGAYFGDGEDAIIDTSLYAYHLYEEDGDEDYMRGLVDWLLYVQNNEGSWGQGITDEKAIPTSYAVLSLFAAGFNRTSEPIRDAEAWASDNEDNLTTNNTAALSSAFYVLKHHARPLLVSTPKVIVIDDPQTTIELFNPTTFDLHDLEYSFSEGIDDDLSIETKEEIDAHSYRRLKITRSAAAREGFGFLTVSNLGDSVAEIPVILTDTPTINVTVPSVVTVFGRKGELPLTAQKSAHTFVCSASWSDGELSSPGSSRVTGERFSVPLEFTQALTKEDSYSGTLTCTAAGKRVSVPLTVYVERYVEAPLSISPSDLIVNYTDRDVTLRLRNNLDRDLVVSVSFDRYGSYFGFSSQVVLDPNEEYNFTLTNNLPSDLNLTSEALLQFEVLGRTEVVSLLLDITESPAEQERLLATLLPLLVVILVLGVAGYFGWKFRDILIAELNKLNVWRVRAEKKKESKRIRRLKETEQQQAIINLFNIMKFQGKDEKEIAQRLLSNFSREDVVSALEQSGARLPSLEEEEPTKA